MLTFSDINKYEPDEWHSEGPFLTSPETLKELESLLEQGRTLIAKHWHYRGAREPNRVVVQYIDDFLEYLKQNAIAGDIIDVFDITELWEQADEPVLSAKCPDERGQVPRRGAY